RIWYGMPAYAQSASTPALVTLRNDERVNLALTEKVDFQSAGGVDGLLMPAAWYFETVDADAEKRIAEIVRSVVGGRGAVSAPPRRRPRGRSSGGRGPGRRSLH